MSGLDDAIDAMQGDMAAHQQRHRGEVTALENQSIAADAFRRLEKERADAKTVPTQVPVAPPIAETRDGLHGRYRISRSPTDDIGVTEATPAQAWFMAHALPRIDLLRTKTETGPLGSPSWQQRVDSVLKYQADANDWRAAGRADVALDLERRFMHELVELLNASSFLFGDWKADPNPLITRR